MSRSIPIYEVPSGTLRGVRENELDRRIRNQGLPSEEWFRLILNNGSPIKFKKILEYEFMSDLKEVVKEQIETMDNLMKMWGDSFNGLKNGVEEKKKFIIKNGGDIKDSVEKFRQSMDKFMSIINEDKMARLAGHISVITECMIKIEELEKAGVLDRFAALVK